VHGRCLLRLGGPDAIALLSAVVVAGLEPGDTVAGAVRAVAGYWQSVAILEELGR
jgi:hypothetical protein